MKLNLNKWKENEKKVLNKLKEILEELPETYDRISFWASSDIEITYYADNCVTAKCNVVETQEIIDNIQNFVVVNISLTLGKYENAFFDTFTISFDIASHNGALLIEKQIISNCKFGQWKDFPNIDEEVKEYKRKLIKLHNYLKTYE